MAYSKTKTVQKSVLSGIAATVATTAAVLINKYFPDIPIPHDQAVIVITSVITAIGAGLTNWMKNRK